MTPFFPKSILTALILASTLTTSTAADALSSLPQPVLLWPEGAPKAVDTQDEDKPAIMAFLPDPDKATGAAILVCPGGSFVCLAVVPQHVLVKFKAFRFLYGKHGSCFSNERGTCRCQNK